MAALFLSFQGEQHKHNTTVQLQGANMHAIFLFPTFEDRRESTISKTFNIDDVMGLHST